MDKFEQVIELQEQGIPRQEIYKIVGYASIDSLTKLMRKRGYRYNEQLQKYIETDSNTVSYTQSNTSIVTYGQQQLSIPQEPIGLIKGIVEEQETLLNMIAWYKKHIEASDDNNFIHIELPKSENTLATVRTNKIVWEQFGEFANANKDFLKGDLLAQALTEYMNKKALGN